MGLIQVDTVYSQLQKYYDDLSSTEQLAIDYILNYPELEHLKLKVIQNDLHISSSTIIRGIKKLGYNTFVEFKYALIAIRKKETVETQDYTYESILQTLSEDFEKTIQMMDEDIVMQIAETILKSRRIFCVGIGSSAGVVYAFNHKLKNYGLWSNDYSEVFPLRDVPDITRNNDCMVVFSLSGSETEIIDTITACKVTGCTIITITGFSNNPLANLSDIKLMINQSQQPRRKLRSRLMLSVASEVIFETIALLDSQGDQVLS